MIKRTDFITSIKANLKNKAISFSSYFKEV